MAMAHALIPLIALRQQALVQDVAGRIATLETDVMAVISSVLLRHAKRAGLVVELGSSSAQLIRSADARGTSG